MRELPSRDPDIRVKLRVCLLQEQGELGRNFLEDPGMEDVIETSREQRDTADLDLDLCVEIVRFQLFGLL